MRRYRLLIGTLAATIGITSLAALAAGNDDEAAIRKQAADFAAAYGKGDARAIAMMWTADGKYIDAGGREHVGRNDIEGVYTQFFKGSGAQPIEVQIESLTFPSPSVAVEVGTTSLPREKMSARYTAVHTKDGDNWLTSNVTESAVNVAVPAPRMSLSDINWLEGTWTATGPKGTTKMKAAWDANHHFLNCEFLGAGDTVESSQVLGWNAQLGTIMSWHFDANGGHGRGAWRRDGSDWNIRASAIEPNGQMAGARYKLHQIDNNNFTWRSMGRNIGGKRLPDSTEVKVTRVN